MAKEETEERKKAWNKILKELDQGFEKPFLTLTEYLKNVSTNKDDMYLVHKGAIGLLSGKSKRKYGKRPNEHKAGLSKLFFKIKNVINKKAIIKSDEHQNYPEFVRHFFPDSTYQRYKGSRGAIVGQGELKKIKRDPLFMINHTCAMLRANINRLFRRTWCTTKDPNMLQKHLNIYIDFHNTVLLKAS